MHSLKDSESELIQLSDFISSVEALMIHQHNHAGTTWPVKENNMTACGISCTQRHHCLSSVICWKWQLEKKNRFSSVNTETGVFISSRCFPWLDQLTFKENFIVLLLKSLIALLEGIKTNRNINLSSYLGSTLPLPWSCASRKQSGSILILLMAKYCFLMLKLMVVCS